MANRKIGLRPNRSDIRPQKGMTTPATTREATEDPEAWAAVMIPWVWKYVDM